MRGVRGRELNPLVNYCRDYDQTVLDQGHVALQEARVPELLNELANIIRPDFPDVIIEERFELAGDIGLVLQCDGVSLMIKWNFRDVSGEPLKHSYNSVNIIARPLTGDLLVMGGDPGKFRALDKSRWSSDPKLVEDAIARAYQIPKRMVDDRPYTRKI